MPDLLHLLIPGAVLPPDAFPATAPTHASDPTSAARALLPPLAQLPRLRALLSALAPSSRITCDEDDPAAPYELALARANQLPGQAGHLPWAAVETATVGTPCAWIKPCHLRVGADHVLLDPIDALGLDEATSRTLLAAMAPYFAEDGITLTYRDGLPSAWLAQGEAFRALRTLSPERWAGRRLTPTALGGAGASASTLRRLQNEMQMLLYTHPANDQRQQQGLLPVNSFWVTGAGVLDQPHAPTPGVVLDTRVLDAAQRGDAAAHAQAWRTLDADTAERLQAQMNAGAAVQLTLCGLHAAQTWGPARAPAWARLTTLFTQSIGLQSASSLLVAL